MEFRATTEQQAQALWRALAAVKVSECSSCADTARLDVEEVGAIALHTDCPRVRRGALGALQHAAQHSRHSAARLSAAECMLDLQGPSPC